MLYYGTNQKAFDNAFSGLSAAEAADLILGRRPLTKAQEECLELAAGNEGYGLRFDPQPVGHVAFKAIATKGCGNKGRHLLVPASKEAARIVRAAQRAAWVEKFAAAGMTPDKAARLWQLCRGHNPTLTAALAAWDVLKHVPNASDRALRDAGLRPRHPIEGHAIEALRSL